VKPSTFNLLVRLAELGCLSRPVKASSVSLARDLSVPQQTVSRWLSQLEDDGLIEKRKGAIVLREPARRHLLAARASLDKAFSRKAEAIVFSGKVFSGFKESAFYLSLPGYEKQFKKLCGYKPFPGTVNIRIPAEQVAMSESLIASEGLLVREWSDGKRTYGGVKAFPCEINGQKGHLIYPVRTHYGPEILQVIAKKRLGLKPGSEAEVVVTRK
jgi:riboflavin kinase